MKNLTDLIARIENARELNAQITSQMPRSSKNSIDDFWAEVGTIIVAAGSQLKGPDDIDWAGVEILRNYMKGGEDMHITNDFKWTEYMKEAPGLERQVRDRLVEKSQELLGEVEVGETVEFPFADVTSMETDNGYQTGYQLLHGTNAHVGGYSMQGKVTITNTGEGYLVQYDLTHSWNDEIDPNEIYPEDKQFNSWVEKLSAGQADPYDIHISWDAQSSFYLDKNGEYVSAAVGSANQWPNDSYVP